MQLKANTPQELRIIRRNDNGSGVVRMPILRASTFENGPYEGEEITQDHLLQAEANFALWPGPVPINVSPHRDFSEDAGPVPGFMESMQVEGDTLYAELFLTASLFSEVEAGQWRGFSVNIWQDLKLPTVSFSGKVVSGGVFTNRPATDVNFKIAAEIEPHIRRTFNVDPNTRHTGAFLEIRLQAEEETVMSETNTVAALEAAIADNNSKLSELEAQLAKEKSAAASLRSLNDKMTSDASVAKSRLAEMKKDLAAANLARSSSDDSVANLELELGDLKRKVVSLESEKREISVRLEAETRRSTGEQVISLVHDAIDRGVSASLFEGVEADPVAWFDGKFNSLESLKQFISALPVVASSAVPSGRPEGKRADLSTDEAKRLKRLGLDPKLSGISNENEYLDLKAEDDS